MEPLSDRYNRLMKVLEMDDPDSSDQKLKDYRKELFGESVISAAPGDWWDYQYMMQSGAIAEWENLSVDTRARIKAGMTINSMKSVIERHVEIMDERRKRALSKHAKT